MSRRSEKVLLEDILEAVGRIERHVAGLDRAGFLNDEKTTDAVVRNLEIIGEASGRLPAEFRASLCDVPWDKIIGLRNRIIHGYFSVDLELIWRILEVDLPAFAAKIREAQRLQP